MYANSNQILNQQQELINARLKMQGDDSHCFE